MIQALKIIGTGTETGLATTGLIWAGVGIGVVFGSLILGVYKKRNRFITGQLFSYAILGFAFSLLLLLLLLLFFYEPLGLFALMLAFCYYLLHKDIWYKEKTEII